MHKEIPMFTAEHTYKPPASPRTSGKFEPAPGLCSFLPQLRLALRGATFFLNRAVILARPPRCPERFPVRFYKPRISISNSKSQIKSQTKSQIKSQTKSQTKSQAKSRIPNLKPNLNSNLKSQISNLHPQILNLSACRRVIP